MGIILKIFSESIFQALGQLRANKLRSFLSLLGITIGIFCIISVKSAIDSLQYNITSSFEKLGDDVIYIDKMPWNEDPNQNFWKYMARPDPSIDDFEILDKKVKSAEHVAYSIYAGSKTMKYKSNYIQGADMVGVTNDYDDIFKIELEKGRYFTQLEADKGSNIIVIGAVIAEELFNKMDPINKWVKIQGQKFLIVGVMKKEGKSLISIVDFDNVIITPFNTVKKLINVNRQTSFGKTLMVKAKDGFTTDDIKDEIIGVLRAKRRLKPLEKNNFATNELSMVADALESVFGVMNMVGLCIGVFAILVGMFSVANIMFVSVKERTPIIGVKKALGAKKGVILLEFLIEAILLCILGGILGLALVFGVIKILSMLLDFEMFVSQSNITLALIISVIVGIVSGLIPAWIAARMDPVEAIRQ